VVANDISVARLTTTEAAVLALLAIEEFARAFDHRCRPGRSGRPKARQYSSAEPSFRPAERS